MIKNSGIKWGVLPFLLSMILLYGVLWLHHQYPENALGVLYQKVIPVGSFVLNLFCLVICYWSYSRVHNFKTFFWGHLSSFFSLVYFSSRSGFPLELDFGPNFLALGVLGMGIQYLLVALIPSDLQYRTTKWVTYGALVVQAGLLWFLAKSPFAALFFSGELLSPTDLGFWTGIGLALVFILVGFFTLKREFYLIGILSGGVLLLLSFWYSARLFHQPKEMQVLLVGAHSLYAVMGLVIHWITSMGHKVTTDPLLQIYNRAYCEKIMSGQASINISPPFTVAMVDIDHFKKVNDRYGHQSGDEVLIIVAQTIVKVLGRKAVVCRYGGEELTAFFPKTSLKLANEMMEKVRAAVQKQVILSGRRKIKVTISVGVAQKQKSSQSIMEIIQAADKALYRAKSGGRNQVKTGKIPIRKKA